MTNVDLARWQFAFVTINHFFFVPVTIGPVRSSGQLLLFSALVDMPPSRSLVVECYCHRPHICGHPPCWVVTPRLPPPARAGHD